MAIILNKLIATFVITGLFSFLCYFISYNKSSELFWACTAFIVGFCIVVCWIVKVWV